MGTEIKYILFDAANTLIHKPTLWKNLQSVLIAKNINVSIEKIKFNHKIISELIPFPDKTSKEFYQEFNSQLLFSLGIIPTQEMLDNIFNNCTYLPWEKFEDTNEIFNLFLPLGILSNFNSTLNVIIEDLFGHEKFSNIFISEKEKVSKPSLQFFNRVFEKLNFEPQEILYIGDSIKLDMEPALKIGMNVLLIDRENYFDNFINRINTLANIKETIENKY
jgi:FMN phosphatase YigB (HAD superfamily)